jgi:hypothetical protein
MVARRRRASWRLGICGASERRMRRSATQGRTGSAADAAAPAPDLGACDVAACMKTMFVDGPAIRGDTVVVGADGASCRQRVRNTVAVAVDAVWRWDACGAGAAGRIAGVRICSAKKRRAPLPNRGYGAPVQHRGRHLAGSRYALSCFHEFYHPCYWARSRAPVLYSLRAGLLGFVKGFNPPAAPELRRVLTDQSVLLAANVFFDMIVVSR